MYIDIYTSKNRHEGGGKEGGTRAKTKTKTMRKATQPKREEQNGSGQKEGDDPAVQHLLCFQAGQGDSASAWSIVRITRLFCKEAKLNFSAYGFHRKLVGHF